MGVLIFDSRLCQLRKEKMLTAISYGVYCGRRALHILQSQNCTEYAEMEKLIFNYAKALLCFFVYYCAKSELS